MSKLVERLLSDARWLEAEGGALNDARAKLLGEAAAALKAANALLTRASLYTDLENFKQEIAEFQEGLSGE